MHHSVARTSVRHHVVQSTPHWPGVSTLRSLNASRSACCVLRTRTVRSRVACPTRAPPLPRPLLARHPPRGPCSPGGLPAPPGGCPSAAGWGPPPAPRPPPGLQRCCLTLRPGARGGTQAGRCASRGAINTGGRMRACMWPARSHPGFTRARFTTAGWPPLPQLPQEVAHPHTYTPSSQPQTTATATTQVRATWRSSESPTPAWLTTSAAFDMCSARLCT